MLIPKRGSQRGIAGVVPHLPRKQRLADGPAPPRSGRGFRARRARRRGPGKLRNLPFATDEGGRSL